MVSSEWAATKPDGFYELTDRDGNPSLGVMIESGRVSWTVDLSRLGLADFS